MIEIKYWNEINSDCLNPNGTLIIYGAGVNGRALLKAGIKPSYFCDKNAKQIGRYILEGETRIPVLPLDELSSLNMDLDIIISPWTRTENQKKAIIDNIRNYLSPSQSNIRFYLDFPYRDLHRISLGSFMVGNKKHYGTATPSQYLRYLSKQERYDNPQYVRDAFYDTDIPMSERFSYQNARTIVFKNNKLAYTDVINGEHRFQSGQRVTVGQPDKYEHTIHIFGNSRIENIVVPDQLTMCSQLQLLLNNNKIPYRISNHGMANLSLIKIVWQIQNTDFSSGDMIIIMASLSDDDIFKEAIIQIKNICLSKDVNFVFVELPSNVLFRKNTSAWESEMKSIILSDNWLIPLDGEKEIQRKEKLSNTMPLLFAKYQIPFFPASTELIYSNKTIFYDWVHWGDYGCELLAKQLFSIVSEFAKWDTFFDIPKEISKELMGETTEFLHEIVENTCPDCEKYLFFLEKYKKMADVAGAIVMNCNPFTKGHRHLIEESAKRVEVLYIFIVQEDKSFFPYEHRFALVKESVKDLKNVIVVPSGKFIISSLTFPEYFTKEIIVDDHIDTSLDLLIFSLKIAPFLDIKVRFAGEEPYDNLTRQYNEQMRRILPQHGIDFVEIPRLSAEKDDVISASKVRKLMLEHRLEELRRYVPDTTYDYLLENYL